VFLAKTVLPFASTSLDGVVAGVGQVRGCLESDKRIQATAA